MKKLLGLLLTLAMVAALGFGTVGCGKDEKDKKKDAATTPAGDTKPKEKEKEKGT